MDVKKFVILTISDTCSAGINVDQSGPQLVQNVREDFPDAIVENLIIPDEEHEIINTLIHYSDIFKADIIFTTGGTGFSFRDVTPEATNKVIHKQANGIATALLVESLKVTPMAMMSRLTSGIRNKTLIINLPGSLKAVKECYAAVKIILPHTIDLLNENKSKTKTTHDNMMNQGIKKRGCGCDNSNIAVIAQTPGRTRQSPYPMIEVQKANELILSTLKKYPIRLTEIQSLSTAFGYVTSQDIKADDPFPPFEASVKDGYACLYEDGLEDRNVCGEIAAGDYSSRVLTRGECTFVNTGAPIPPGANCVIQIEDTKVVKHNGDKEETIKVLVAPEKDQDIRAIGSDIAINEVVIPKGKIIGPAEIGLLATLGKVEVPVFKKPTIAIMSSGNEIKPYSVTDLNKGQIRDSNKYMLMSLFRDYPCKDFGIVNDDPSKIKDAITEAFNEADILITTGGVSMGDKDFFKPVLINDFKAEILFGRVNMRPGKPATFATCVFNDKQKFVFALPGNPVSALVTSHILVKPALMYWVGVDNFELTKLNVLLDEDVELDPRPHFARASMRFSSIHNSPLATLTGNQMSSRLINSSGADILLALPGRSEDSKILKRYRTVEAILI